MKSKHVVITGGSNGIGKSIARAFLNAGFFVSVIDVDEVGAQAFDNEKYTFYRGDIAESSVLEAFVKTLDKPVDCLINNACVSRKGLLSSCTWEEFEYVQRVGVIAPYYMVRLLLDNGKLASDAAVVNIASTRAFQSQKDTESYSAAKGGIVALTHAMSVSLAGKARVNAISPGWIDTQVERSNRSGTAALTNADKQQHPAGRIGTPNDIAEMVLFLCDNTKAGFITGENIVIDGGMSRLMVYHGDDGWRLDN